MWFRNVRALFNLKFRRERFDGLIKSASYSVDVDTGRWNAEIRAKHPDFTRYLHALVYAFQESGAVNFLTITLTCPATFEQFTVVIKKRGGREPEELTGILRYAVEQIEAGKGNAQETARRALEMCGYTQATKTGDSPRPTRR